MAEARRAADGDGVEGASAREKDALLEQAPHVGSTDGPSAPQHPELSSGDVFAFGVGAVGDSVFGGMFNGFITIYFNQAVGLSNSLIGTAIML